MGSLAGSIFDLIEGNPTAGEQSEFGTLGNEQIGTGENLVTPAATYYEDILSGDPTKIAQSLAPEISAGQNQVEQQALTGSEFGTRSGGTAAANNAAEGQERGNIINLVGGLQQGAASAAGNLGTEQENMGSGNVSKEADLATQNRQRETTTSTESRRARRRLRLDLLTRQQRQTLTRACTTRRTPMIHRFSRRIMI